jgi:mannitol-1-/sugar-/sorbitol-6-phosphatase
MPRFDAVEAIVFDNDGVLVDSFASVERAWRRWSIEQGLDPEVVMPTVHGRPSRETVAALLAPELVGAALQRIDDLEIEDAAGVTALPGAVGLLASLPAGRWAIVTSATTALFEVRRVAAGLPRPAVVVTADHVSRGKPDPEGYLAAMWRLGVSPVRAAVFEDSSSGIVAALAAGVGTVIRLGTGKPGRGEAAVVADLRSVAWREGLAIDDETATA